MFPQHFSAFMICLIASGIKHCPTPTEAPQPQSEAQASPSRASPSIVPPDLESELLPKAPSCDYDLYAVGSTGVQCVNAEGIPQAKIVDFAVDDGFAAGQQELLVWSSATRQIYLVDTTTGKILKQESLVPPVPEECNRGEIWPDTQIIFPGIRPSSLPSELCFEVANGDYEDIENLRFSGILHLPEFSVSYSRLWNSTSCSFQKIPQGSRCPDGPFDESSLSSTPDYPYYVSKGVVSERLNDRESRRVAGVIEGTRKTINRTSSGLDVITNGLDSFEPVGVTRSGRYIVLAGNVTAGDVRHFEVLLFDRKSGEIYPLPATATETWPGPLSHGLLRDLHPGAARTLAVLKGVSPRFVPNSDVFAVESLLFSPLENVVRLPGRLVVGASGESKLP